MASVLQGVPKGLLPKGCFPTMITPFVEDGSAIDWPILDALTDWYVRAGCTGLFACCLSSEMYDLSPTERIELARRVKQRAGDGVAVVASGTFGGTVEEQADFVNKMAAEVDAVVVLTCQLAAEGEGEDVWKSNVERLLELTGDAPLGMYECPAPYLRLLSPALLRWAAGTGRFRFHKDVSCDTAAIRAKLDALADLPPDTPFRFYNANVETLKFSNDLGGAGFSGISANFYPWLHVRLCDGSLSDADAERVQRFLSVAEQVVVDGYPKCAKAYLAQHAGFGIQLTCRKAGMAAVAFNEVQQRHLRHMQELVEDLCTRTLDSTIAIVAPSSPS
eukprot:g1319.t1